MGYVEGKLMANEQVVVAGKVHWLIFAPGIAVLTIGLLAPAEISPTGGILMILASIGLTRAYITFINTQLAVTTKRVIAKFGFCSRNAVELSYINVENLNVNQGMLGRLFGFGTITIHGAGGVRAPIRLIVNPLEIRRKAIEQMEVAKA